MPLLLIARRRIYKAGGNGPLNRLHHTGGSAYSAGPDYTGSTYISNHQPLNYGDGPTDLSNHGNLNRRAGLPGQGQGKGAGYDRNEPAADQTSLVSFEDSIQNVVF